MTSEPSWKEKYLAELDDAERREKRWQAKVNSLERMLVRTSLASEGQDHQLDQSLSELRKLLRKSEANEAQWQALQDQIEKRICYLDEHREESTGEANANKGGLLQRLLGRTDPPEDISRPVVPPDEALDVAPAGEDLVGEDSPDQRIRIARRVGQLLSQLRQQVVLEPDVGEQARLLQDLLLHGQDWDDLREGLNGVAELVISAVTRSQKEFEGFLRRLDERLQALQHHFAEQQAAQSGRQTASRELELGIREELDAFGREVDASNDLSELKASVTSHLASVSEAISQYRDQETEREVLLTQQLEAMQEKLAAVEVHREQMSEQLRQERSRALTDLLTGLPNREAWEERLELEYNRWSRYGHALSVAVLDIDYFKRVNDSYGHKAGDRVLQLVAKTLQERLRNTDFIARYGGEEFVVLLPDTTAQSGQQVLNEVREHIAGLPFHFRGEPVSVTFSAGVVQFLPDENVEDAFDRADKALYRAKNSGRNRILTDATD